MCAPCYRRAQEEGGHDVCFNWELMYFMAQGEAPAVWTVDTIARVESAAGMYHWDGECLWLLSKCYPGFESIKPPIWHCQVLVSEVQSMLGYPGRKQVAALICQHYYWAGLLVDCLDVCLRAEPYQKVRAKLDTNPPYLYLNSKGGCPFLVWCIDLITGMEDTAGPGGEMIIVVYICAFLKWIEAGALSSRLLAQVADRFHTNITCRFGVHAIIRSD